MPKELIESADFGRTGRLMTDGSSEQAVEVPLDWSAVKVGWSKEAEHVELAVVEFFDGRFLEHGIEVEGVEGRYPPRYIQLDRYGINRLIRVLRQARDNAYGKDA